MTTKPGGTIGNVRTTGFHGCLKGVRGCRVLRARQATEEARLVSRRAASHYARFASDGSRRLDPNPGLVQQGSLGRFRRDTTLTTKAAEVLAELDKLSALAAGGAGALEATHPDSLLTKELSHTLASCSLSLFET